MTITTAEILDALQQAMSAPAPRVEGAFTTRELVKASGIGEKQLRVALGELHERGQLEVFRVVQVGLAGQRAIVPAYRFKGGVKRKGKR